MINIYVRGKGYITVTNYNEAADLVNELEETPRKFIYFEVTNKYYDKFPQDENDRMLTVHININDIITVENVIRWN